MAARLLWLKADKAATIEYGYLREARTLLIPVIQTYNT